MAGRWLFGASRFRLPRRARLRKSLQPVLSDKPKSLEMAPDPALILEPRDGLAGPVRDSLSRLHRSVHDPRSGTRTIEASDAMPLPVTVPLPDHHAALMAPWARREAASRSRV